MKKAVLCVKDEIVRSPFLSPAEYVVEMTNYCSEKKIKPIGCIFVNDSTMPLFRVLIALEKKIKNFDYFIIFSQEQMRLDSIQMLMLCNKVSDNFGADILVLHPRQNSRNSK